MRIAHRSAPTLIDKLFTLHHLATVFEPAHPREEPEADEAVGHAEEEEQPRLGRHYYDIHQLLGDAPTRQALARDREEFDRMVADVEAFLRRHFGGTTPRPEEGFAASPAFARASTASCAGGSSATTMTLARCMERMLACMSTTARCSISAGKSADPLCGRSMSFCAARAHRIALVKRPTVRVP